MKLVSMEKKPEVKKEIEQPTLTCCDEPKYPYGLKITLCDDQLIPLGIPTLPAVGSEMLMQCRVKITSARQEETQDEGTESYVDMQIIAMGTEGIAKGMFDHPSRVREED